MRSAGGDNEAATLKLSRIGFDEKKRVCLCDICYFSKFNFSAELRGLIKESGSKFGARNIGGGWVVFDFRS